MSTLFDIFGSHEVRTPSQDGLAVKPPLPLKDVLPGKQRVRNEPPPSAKGKRVLGDLKNKIHTARVTDSAKKAQVENVPCKLNEKASFRKEEACSSQKKPEHFLKTPVSKVLEGASAQTVKLQEPETQGPSFWNENEYLGFCEIPSKEDYMRKAKFWDLNIMAPLSLDFPLTPWSDSLDEPDMFDVPSSPPRDTMFEAPEVEFPW